MRKLIVLPMMFITLCLQAQNISQFTTYTSDVSFDTVNEQTRVTEFKQIGFALEDLSGVGSVEVLLGSTEGASDYLSKTWPAAADTNLVQADNIWFTREGILVSAGLGTWINREQAYLTIRVKNTSGGIISQRQEIVY